MMIDKDDLLLQISVLLKKYLNSPVLLDMDVNKEVGVFYGFNWGDGELADLLFGGRASVNFDEIIGGLHHNLPFEKISKNFVSCKHSIEPIFLEVDKEKQLEFGTELSSTNCLYPLFDFEGSYIYYFDSGDRLQNGLISEVDSIGVYFAPSIESHLEDIYKGVKSGVYPIIDDEVIYPSAWHDRAKLHSGKIYMDKYGNII